MQHYAFIKNKSSEGVSTFTVLISNVAAYTIFLVGVLTNWDQILCCRTLVRTSMLARWLS